jgi:hypothetical protein
MTRRRMRCRIEFPAAFPKTQATGERQNTQRMCGNVPTLAVNREFNTGLVHQRRIICTSVAFLEPFWSLRLLSTLCAGHDSLASDRKFPRQGHGFKLDSRAACGPGRQVRGGARPRLSWDRSSLYSLGQLSATSRSFQIGRGECGRSAGIGRARLCFIVPTAMARP